MPKSKLSKMFRLVNKLEDGRKVYLSVDGKIVIMTKLEAEFWDDSREGKETLLAAVGPSLPFQCLCLFTHMHSGADGHPKRK